MRLLLFFGIKNTIMTNKMQNEIQLKFGLKNAPHRFTRLGLPYSLAYENGKIIPILFCSKRSSKHAIISSKNELMRFWNCNHIDVIPYDDERIVFDRQVIRKKLCRAI